MSRNKKNSGLELWSVLRALLFAFLSGFLLFSISEKLNEPVDNILIKINKDDSDKKLISEKEVRAILKLELGYDASIAEIQQLNIYHLEKVLNKNERIDNAEIYLDKHNVLHVNVKQKLPIVRINVTDNSDYYLDYKGERVPVTDIYRVPVVTGKVHAYKEGFRENKKHNLNAILEVAKKVHDDEFLTALVEQIHVNSENEITLVPKVGRNKILLGQVEDLDEKIYKLKTYYERGIKNIGLGRFDELDLQIKGQVIGREENT